MATAPGTLRFGEITVKPPAPPAGYALIYIKTDNILYLQDSSATEIPLGSASSITGLTGEATATGPGVVPITLSNSAVIGKVLTGFTSGPNSIVLATDTILQAFQKLQAQVSATTGAAITSLTGDVTATGPGAAAATVVSVGGSSAANVNSATLLANAATSANTASTIVRRDVSGNFSAGTITANLLGNATNFTGSLVGDVTGTQSATIVSLVGGSTAANVNLATIAANAATSANTASTIVKRDASGNFSASALTISSLSLTGTSDIVQGIIKGFSTQTNDIFQVLKSDNTVLFKVTNAGNGTLSGTITASNFTGSSSGTNTGDVTITDTNSIDLTLASQNISADLKLSSDAADAGNLKATTTIHSGGGAGLHIEYPFATPVNVGTTNIAGSASSFALSDHVHALTAPVTTGQLLTGYVIGANTPISATDSILGAFQKVQGQISATAGSAITALTGDVVATGPGSVASTIQTNVVSNPKLAQMPANTIKGNNTGVTANSLDLTTAQVNTLLGTVTTIGTIDTNANSNGLFISGNTLSTQSASATNPGMVNNTTQTLSGNKTFSGQTAISNTSTTALTINSTAFVFDATNNALGIGIAPQTTTFVDGINSSLTSKTFEMTGYGIGSTVGTRGRFARGTSGTPAAAQNGDIINFWSGRGYGTSQFAAASTGSINVVAGETFTNTSNLTYLQFNATPTGSVTSVDSMRINSTGVTLGPQTSSTSIHQLNGGVRVTRRTVTAGFTIDTTTSDYLILCNNTGAITITLPTPTDGRLLIIKDINGNASTNNITIARHAAEQIEGLSSDFIFQTNYGVLNIYSDGTNWWLN